MKLLTKTSLLYLALSVPIVLLAGFVSYILITSEVRESNDELLKNRLTQVESYLQNNDSVAIAIITRTGEASIAHLPSTVPAHVALRDTSIFDEKEKEPGNFRLIEAVVKINGQTYNIQLSRSTIEYQELLSGFFFGLSAILLLLAIVLFSLNYFISRKLWQPFYLTLNALRGFQVSDGIKPSLSGTNTDEFRRLNASVSSMMDKLLSDFKSQKQFAENASHEMQTPLAVMKAKIDLLIQSEVMREEEMQYLNSLNDSINKLVVLNRSLLLLTKIDNHQFVPEENVSLNDITRNSLQSFTEYLQAREIKVDSNLGQEVKVKINPSLGEILIRNLLQNAIRHNRPGGKITIELNEHKLLISNSGDANALNADDIFKRFHKGTTSSESVGLGLSIARQIAEVSGMTLTYSYENNLHVFTVLF